MWLIDNNFPDGSSVNTPLPVMNINLVISFIGSLLNYDFQEGIRIQCFFIHFLM
jgi:hypothetical protein